MSEVRAELIVRWLADGGVEVQSPPDLMLAYGLLEIAKDAVRARHEKAVRVEQSRIAVVAALPPRNGQVG